MTGLETTRESWRQHSQVNMDGPGCRTDDFYMADNLDVAQEVNEEAAGLHMPVTSTSSPGHASSIGLRAQRRISVWSHRIRMRAALGRVEDTDAGRCNEKCSGQHAEHVPEHRLGRWSQVLHGDVNPTLGGM